ncbi:hypothetical protein BaRGS_00018828, partial [Batillaria attramentaria]
MKKNMEKLRLQCDCESSPELSRVAEMANVATRSVRLKKNYILIDFQSSVGSFLVAGWLSVSPTCPPQVTIETRLGSTVSR